MPVTTAHQILQPHKIRILNTLFNAAFLGIYLSSYKALDLLYEWACPVGFSAHLFAALRVLFGVSLGIAVAHSLVTYLVFDLVIPVVRAIRNWRAR